MSKNYVLKSAHPHEPQLRRQLAKVGPQPLICLGLDVELGGAQGSIIIGGGTPLNLGKHTRSTWLALAAWLVEQRGTVHVVQEACGFGWQFHRDLEAAQTQSLVVAPTDLSGRRKTDKRDARALALALWDRVQHGNLQVLHPVRIPSEQELRDRDYGRMRAQLREQRNRLDLQMRSLMRNHDFLSVPEMWWHAAKWAKLKPLLLEAGQAWLVTMLEPVQSFLLELQKQMDALEIKLVGTLQTKNLKGQTPKGLGELTRAQFATEMMDWNRFSNRGQPGSMIGACPSEYSSAKSQKLGSIDRIGNPTLRAMSVEAVWRMKKWNPTWRGFVKFPEVLAAPGSVGAARRKKAIVACARLLMVDMWRIETGRIQLSDVGLVA